MGPSEARSFCTYALRMGDQENLQEPLSEREVQHSAPYGLVLARLGLDTPQGQSETGLPDPVGSAAAAAPHPGDCDCGWNAAHLEPSRAKIWPEDY